MGMMEDIKTLREMSGAGMMACKDALIAKNGDIEKAMEFLREKGMAAVAKKAGRIAAEGAVGAYVSEDMKIGAIVEINCETDFVAKADAFQALVKTIAKHVAIKNPKFVNKEEIPESVKETMTEEELQKYCEENCLVNQTALESNQTVTQLIEEATLKIGEKIAIRRFARYEAEKGILGSYIHLGGKIGVLTQLNCEKEDPAAIALIKDCNLQIAAMKARYLARKDVPASEIEHEKEIMIAQIKNDPKTANKPDNIIEKMVEGKIKKYYEENCLLEQEFFKEPELKMADFVKREGTKMGQEIELEKFARFEMGEGLEKRKDDFAEEVMKQTAGK